MAFCAVADARAGHWIGLDHSAVIRAMTFRYAAPPGQYLGDRPDGSVPNGPPADHDRTGIRAKYPDPNHTLNVGANGGRIFSATSLALAAFAAPAAGGPVSGMVGAHVVAVDAETGSVIAGRWEFVAAMRQIRRRSLTSGSTWNGCP